MPSKRWMGMEHKQWRRGGMCQPFAFEEATTLELRGIWESPTAQLLSWVEIRERRTAFTPLDDSQCKCKMRQNWDKIYTNRTYSLLASTLLEDFL